MILLHAASVYEIIVEKIDVTSPLPISIHSAYPFVPYRTYSTRFVRRTSEHTCFTPWNITVGTGSF